MLNQTLVTRRFFSFRTTLAFAFLVGSCVSSAFGQSQQAEFPPAENVAEEQDVDETMFRFRLVDTQGTAMPAQEVRFHLFPRLEEIRITSGEHLHDDRNGFYAKTDEQGRIGFELAADVTRLSIRIKAPMLGPYMADWDNRKKGNEIPKEFTAKVERAWKVGGIVVDEDGKPIAGVKISPSIRYRMPPTQSRQLNIGARVFTDESGAWEVSMVPDSLADVHAEVSHR